VAQAELKGNIQFMSLGTLLSINCHEQRTVRLEIENKSHRAEIFIENGEIVHAALGSEIGEAAFNKIIAFKEGIFTSYVDEKAPEKSIHKNWSKLLLDATRLLDEGSTNNKNKQTFDWSNFELTDLGIEDVEKFMDDRLQRMVKALRRVKGIVGVTAISYDFKILENDADYDENECIQLAQTMLITGQKLENYLGAGYFSYTFIKEPQTRILINRGQDMIYLAAEEDISSDQLIDEIFMIMKRYR